MNLKIAQVIGLNTDQKAAQVISAARNGENSFLAVLDLSCDDAFTKGRQALSELADFYFDFEGTPAEKLNAAFAEANKKFETEDLSAPVPDGTGPAGPLRREASRQGFAILLAAISGKILYLISKGEVAVYLKRSEKLSPLLSVGAPNQLISGFLKEDDRLLLSTSSLISFLGDDLSKSLSLPLETFEEELTDRIGASNLENQGLAALVVEVESVPLLSGTGLEVPNLEQEKPAISTSGASSTVGINKLLRFLWSKTSYLPKSGRARVALAVVLIIIISVGVGFKIKTARDTERQTAFNQALQQAKDDFNAAKGLASLNPTDAKAKLDMARSKVNMALSLASDSRDAKELKKQIEQDAGTILQQSNVSEFPQFYDMDLIKKNFRASKLSLSNGTLLVLDEEAKTLVKVDLAKKSHQILAGSQQLGEATMASLNGGLAFVYSKDKGILRVDITNSKLTSVVKKDSEWGEIKDIYGFSGNVYLLDLGKKDATGSGQIWKYLVTADGYSDKREYLNKNTKADFGSAIRMQIESSIYILGKDGAMLRFTRGDKDNFSYAGLPSAVKDPKSFFVSSDTDNLYLLDSGNSRLLILTKTGSYKGTITGSKFTQASDLVVDEKGKKVYLLDGGKIYFVDLK